MCYSTDIATRKGNTMTWEELRDLINRFTPEQLAQNVSIYVPDTDEFHVVWSDDEGSALATSDDSCDVLDPGHKYLTVC
jgi:hypothetical protein